MNWFTHFTRPARSGFAPGGRNHVRRSSDRTLCGVRLQAWMRNRVIVLDPLTGDGAYPDCKVCTRLSERHGLPARPVDPIAA
jgi:hypothetical protein